MSFSLTHTAIEMIQSAGYAGLALGLIVDSAGVPIPSEVLIPAAAVGAERGTFSLPAVVIIATLAQLFGGIIAYEIGRYGGLPLLQKYGKYFFISQKDLSYTHDKFVKYGYWLAMTGRCVPVIRGYVGFVAGIATMPRTTFWLATLIGSFVWTVILTALGWYVSDNVEAIDRAFRPFAIIIVMIIVAAAGWWLYHRVSKPKSS